MRRLLGLAVIAGIVAVLVGCEAAISIFSPQSVVVRLVNTTAFEVEAEIYTSEDDNILVALITELGDRFEETIPPGGTVTLVQSCEELQAIVITDADLRLFGGVGPETQSDLLLDGQDFHCGDEIVFTFTQDGFGFDVVDEVR